MLNRITITGRLCADPELRHTKTEIAVCSCRIACARDYAKEGEQDTDFFDVTAWRSTAEFIRKHFTKGRVITLDGRMQGRDWTDKDGKKRTSYEVVADNAYFGDSKPADASAAGAPAASGSRKMPEEFDPFG